MNKRIRKKREKESQGIKAKTTEIRFLYLNADIDTQFSGKTHSQTPELETGLPSFPDFSFPKENKIHIGFQIEKSCRNKNTCNRKLSCLYFSFSLAVLEFRVREHQCAVFLSVACAV